MEDKKTLKRSRSRDKACNSSEGRREAELRQLFNVQSLRKTGKKKGTTIDMEGVRDVTYQAVRTEQNERKKEVNILAVEGIKENIEIMCFA